MRKLAALMVCLVVLAFAIPGPRASHATCICNTTIHTTPVLTGRGSSCTAAFNDITNQKWNYENCTSGTCWDSFVLTDSCHLNTVVNQWQESGYFSYRCNTGTGCPF